MHRFFVGALAVGVPLVGRHCVPDISVLSPQL